MRFKRSQQDAEVATSSMADIAFLLIVYFMVTTTFAATRGLDFALPKEDDTPPIIEKEESVLIEINPGGNLVVDGKPMQLTEVLDYLQPKLERNKMKPVIIRPQPESEYGYMVDVYDELRQAKDKIGIEIRNITIPTEREIERFWY